MTPPLDDAATRLLAAVDAFPVRLGERERVMRALGVAASTEWNRVVLGLTREQLDALRRPGLLYAPNDLEHVVGVARSVAAVYGFEHTSIPHLAVGLVLTARFSDGQGPMLPVVTEAFGLGTLENPTDAVNHYLLARERGPEVEPIVDGVRITPMGVRLHHAGIAVHALLRVAAAGVLGVLAVQGAWWLWAVALAALVTSRDSRATKLKVVQEITLPLLFLRWPVTAGLTVVTSALGQPTAAWVLLTLLLATDVVMYVGEALLAREDQFHGPEFQRRSLALRRMVSIPESFATRRRCARMLIVLVVAVAPTIAVALPNPLYVLAAFLVAHRLSGFAVLTLAVALLLDFTPSAAVIAVAAGALAVLAIHMAERPPEPRLPVAPPLALSAGVTTVRTDRRARRLLRRGRPMAAVKALSAAPPHSVHAAVRGWALLAADRPAEAKNAVAPLKGQPIHGLVTGLAELALGNAEQAMAALIPVTDPVGQAPWARTFRTEHAIAVLRAAAGKQLDVVDTFASALPSSVTRANLLSTIDLIRLAAQSALDWEPQLASKLAGLGAFLVHWAGDGRTIREYGLLGAERALYLAMTRCAALMAVADLRAGSTSVATVATVETLGADTGAAHFLLRLDRPLEAAAVLNALADHLELTSQRLAALDSRIEALSVLLWLRHQLADLEERRLWWRTAGDTLVKAMRQSADGQDWLGLAELIESTRLQLAPHVSETTVGGAAPFIRVRGVSRLAAGSWYQPGERPPMFDLEDMAAYVRGPGTWWWSTWSVGDRLYWTLVPPSGEVSGGFLSCAPNSPLATTLADLRDALPIRYPGELPSGDVFNERVEAGALCGPPAAEAALARRLGELLPPPLRRRLAHPGPPLPLAIAPALPLANVPWVLVGVERNLRLVECARIAIAPPSGLLAAVATRIATASSLRLAVLNPGDTLNPPDEERPAADALAAVLPADVTTMTATDLMTVAELGEVLPAVPSASSAVFACHTHPGDGTPLRGGLLVRPGDAPEILTAGASIETPDRYPIPEQVLVLACESADLRQAAAGERLVLGSALLWAGARRLVVTSYATPDDDVVDRALIECLRSGGDLADELRVAQLGQLARWRADGSASPVTWGGHVAMGAFGQGQLRAVRARPSRYVHRTVLTLVDDAARIAAVRGRAVVALSDLVLELGIHGFEETLPRGRRLVLQATGRGAWLVWARRRPAPAGVTLGPEVRALLAAASRVADHARHHVLHIEHVLVALLAARGWLPGLARRLSGWDGRQPEVTRELVDETQNNFQHVELPRVRYLTRQAVADVYATCSVDIPDTEGEPMLVSDL